MVTEEKARRLLTVHGETSPQSPGDWQGSFPLPPCLEKFYREVGPIDITIEGYGNPYFLPRLASLWSFQAGYRWNSLSGEPIEGWDDDWLVVADEGGDPFILSRSSGVVSYASHGQGEWDPDELFPDLNTMAASLGVLGAIIQEAGLDFTDDDCQIRSEYRKQAFAQLHDLLDSRRLAKRILAILGWR
jgi:hypothetical protein